MSLLTEAYVIEKFGIRLDVGQLAELTGCARNTVTSKISTGIFPIPTYREEGVGKRYASYQAVAEYLDRMHEQAQREFERREQNYQRGL